MLCHLFPFNYFSFRKILFISHFQSKEIKFMLKFYFQCCISFKNQILALMFIKNYAIAAVVALSSLIPGLPFYALKICDFFCCHYFKPVASEAENVSVLYIINFSFSILHLNFDALLFYFSSFVAFTLLGDFVFVVTLLFHLLLGCFIFSVTV